MKRLIVAATLLVAFSLPMSVSAATPTSYLSFLTRQSTATHHISSHIANAADYIDYYDFDGAASVMTSVISDENIEINWLKAHTPTTCYKRFWNWELNWWTQMRETAVDMRTGLQTYDISAFDRANVHMDKAETYQNLMKANPPSCVSGTSA